MQRPRGAGEDRGMDETRAPYGASMLVAVGWFVTMLGAAAVGEWSVPDWPRDECFACLDASVFVGPILAVSAVPLLVVLMAVTAVVTRWPLPAPIAGTVSALATAVLVAAVIAALAAG
jgi:hypothetical protein